MQPNSHSYVPEPLPVAIRRTPTTVRRGLVMGLFGRWRVKLSKRRGTGNQRPFDFERHGDLTLNLAGTLDGLVKLV